MCICIMIFFVFFIFFAGINHDSLMICIALPTVSCPPVIYFMLGALYLSGFDFVFPFVFRLLAIPRGVGKVA